MRRTAAVLCCAGLALAGCATSTSGTGHNVGPVISSAPVGDPTPVPTDTSGPSDTSAPTTAAAALPDPCSLLTLAEAEQLAGTTLNKPVSAGPDGMPTLCQFTGVPTGPTAQVEVLIGDGVEKALSIDRDELKHSFVTVPGIGDQCLLEDDNIFIHKGTNWVQINLVLLNDASQNVDPLKKAATEIANRLP